MTTKHEVKVGQVYRDNDKRAPGRTIRVEHILNDTHVHCRVLTEQDGTPVRDRNPRMVRVRKDRLHIKPRASGFTWIESHAC